MKKLLFFLLLSLPLLSIAQTGVKKTSFLNDVQTLHEKMLDLYAAKNGHGDTTTARTATDNARAALDKYNIEEEIRAIPPIVFVCEYIASIQYYYCVEHIAPFPSAYPNWQSCWNSYVGLMQVCGSIPISLYLKTD